MVNIQKSIDSGMLSRIQESDILSNDTKKELDKILKSRLSTLNQYERLSTNDAARKLHALENKPDYFKVFQIDGESYYIFPSFNQQLDQYGTNFVLNCLDKYVEEILNDFLFFDEKTKKCNGVKADYLALKFYENGIYFTFEKTKFIGKTKKNIEKKLVNLFEKIFLSYNLGGSITSEYKYAELRRANDPDAWKLLSGFYDGKL